VGEPPLPGLADWDDTADVEDAALNPSGDGDEGRDELGSWNLRGQSDVDLIQAGGAGRGAGPQRPGVVDSVTGRNR